MIRRGGDAGRARDRPIERAAVLAALAEACAIALPLHLLVTEAGPGASAPGPFVAAFLVVFAGGAGVVASFRDEAWITVVVVAGAIAAGLWVGRGALGSVAFTLPITLLLGWRIATLGLRDPATPMGTSIVVIAAALASEAIAAAGARPSWTGPLVVLIPLGFATALASRATTVWSEDDADELTADVRRAWIGRALLLASGLAAGMVAVAALGLRGGVLDRLAAWLAPIGNLLASTFVWIATQVSRPFLWLAERVRLDPEGVRRALSSLRRDADEARRAAERGVVGGSGVGRVLAFVVFATAIVALIALIRRSRPPARSFERAARGPGTTEVLAAGVAEEPMPGGLRRSAPPADRVRRWYAETLVALARAGVAKERSATPAEFRDDVGRRFPRIAEGFATLTEAYEAVRYGAAHLDATRLGRLRSTHRSLMADLRRMARDRGRPGSGNPPDRG